MFTLKWNQMETIEKRPASVLVATTKKNSLLNRNSIAAIRRLNQFTISFIGFRLESGKQLFQCLRRKQPIRASPWNDRWMLFLVLVHRNTRKNSSSRISWCYFKWSLVWICIVMKIRQIMFFCQHNIKYKMNRMKIFADRKYWLIKISNFAIRKMKHRRTEFHCCLGKD